MYDKKIRVSLVYKKSYNYFQPDHFDQTSYDFFFKALKRNDQLEISYYPCEKKFDISKIKGKCDVILLPNNRTDGSPDVLIGIKNSNIPVISRTGDPHDAERYNQIEFCEENKIVTFGIKPSEADCNFGYIKKGKIIDIKNKFFDFKLLPIFKIAFKVSFA